MSSFFVQINYVHLTMGLGYLSRYSNSLQAGWSGDRIPAAARFSPPIHTGTGAHSASYTMGTGSFPRVKWPGRGIDHPSPSSTKDKQTVRLYLYSQWRWWSTLACWPLVPTIAGSLPAKAVRFFQVKKSSAFLPSEGK
jgi:hypothetical protein